MDIASELSPFIQQSDPKGFLQQYLEIIITGVDLPIPSHLELAGIQQGWNEILPSIVGGYSDEFIAELSRTWLQVVKKQGGTINETFAQDCLAILQGRPVTPTKPAATATKAQPPQQGPGQPGPAPAQQTAPNPEQTDDTVTLSREQEAPEVKSKISDQYYQTTPKLNQKNLNKSESSAQCVKAIDKEKPLLFIQAYIQLAQQEPKQYDIPKSTLLPTILSQWRDIIQSEFEKMPPDDFLVDLSKKWHKLVLKFGIGSSPTVLTAIRNTIETELAKSSNPVDKPLASSNGNGIFKALRNLFG